MLYIIIGMGLLFIAIGFIVTEGNAKYLLAGYNTMSEEERSKFDIQSYLVYFRKFHLFLGISFMALGAIITYFINENIGGMFLVVYPSLAYIYFVISSSKYSKGLSKKYDKLGIYILIGTLLFSIGIVGYGYMVNKLSFGPNTIEFHGSYGETVSPTDIKSIELVNQLPKITIKTDGYAMGTIKKGYFKTDKGEKVKLVLNSDKTPYLLFTKLDGKKIYYSAKEGSNEEVFEAMKGELPENLFGK